MSLINTRSSSRTFLTVAMVLTLLLSMLASSMGPLTTSAQTVDRPLVNAVPADSVFFLQLDLNPTSSQALLSQELLDRSGISAFAQDSVGLSPNDLGSLMGMYGITGEAALVLGSLDGLVNAATSTALQDPGSFDVADVESLVPAGFAVVLQPDSVDTVSMVLTGLVQGLAEDEGGVIETSEYNGAQVSSWVSSSPDVPGVAWVVADDVIVVATQVSDLSPVLDVVQGNAPSLADSDDFNAVSNRLPAETIMFAYADMGQVIDTLMSNEEFVTIATSAADMAQIEASRGPIGAALYASTDGFHFDIVSVPVDPAIIAAVPTFDPSMAAQVPADVLLFGNANNLPAAGIPEMLGEIIGEAFSYDEYGNQLDNPMSADEAWAMMEEQLGFNPNTDLLQKLDGEYAVYAAIQGIDTGSLNPEVLFVAQSSDAASLEQVTSALTDLMTEMTVEEEVAIDSRVINGTEVTQLAFNSDMTEGIPVVIDYGVIDGQLMIGINGAIDKFVSADGDKLANDANFQATFAEMPSEGIISIGYLNIQNQVLPLIDMIVASSMGAYDTPDNDENCGNYATQQEAQEAYEADTYTLWYLDLNFNGIACEDYFDDGTVEVATESISEMIHISSAGMVSWTDGEALYINTILLIGD